MQIDGPEQIREDVSEMRKQMQELHLETQSVASGEIVSAESESWQALPGQVALKSLPSGEENLVDQVIKQPSLTVQNSQTDQKSLEELCNQANFKSAREYLKQFYKV